MDKQTQTALTWAEVFVDAVLKYSEFILKDSRVANQHYGSFVKALKELSRFGDAGLATLANLLDDDRLVVRVTAACYLLHYRTEKALKVLMAAAKENDRAISMLATVTVKRWENGSYLDPATGKEVGRQRKEGPAK